MRSFRQIVSFLPREDWIVVGWVMAMKLLLFYFGATSYAVVRTPAAVAGLTKQASDHTPRFLPLILLLSVLLWVLTTTGGRQVFVKEVFGGAYDSSAQHFLRGDVDVDAEAISHEAMIVNDHVRMYFGPFPALLRIPLNFAYPAGHGKWSRISGFCAA